MPPVLSACIIARNAAATLGDTLTSLRSVADEIVVVDTGSTDGTRAIAHAAGARVETFVWVDDFSAAVNHAVGQCRLPWVFNLDSDETLMPHSIAELKSLIDRPDLFAATVLRRDLFDLADRTRYSRMRQLRLFRNDPQLTYRGRIHRQFVPPASDLAAQQGMVIANSTIEIEHVGYTGTQPQTKLQRNTHHMELELQDRPDQFYYLVELGRTYLLLNDPRGGPLLRRAAELAATASARRQLPRPMLAQLLEYLIVSASLPPEHPCAPGPALPLQEALRIAQEDFPNNAPLIHHRANRAFAAHDFEEATRLLEHLLDLGQTHSYDADASFHPDILAAKTQLNLGACHVRTGRLNDAETQFKALRDDPQYGAAAKQNLDQIRAFRASS